MVILNAAAMMLIKCDKCILLHYREPWYQKQVQIPPTFLSLDSRLQQKLTGRTSLLNETLFASVDFTTAQPCLLDHTLQCLALIRTALVAEKHSAGLHDEFSLLVENSNIAIEADSDVTLLVFETDLLGGVETAPADHVFDGEFAGGGFGPEDADAQAYTADAAPGGEEIAFALFGGGFDGAGDVCW